MKILESIERVIDVLCKILEGLAGICMAFLTLDVFIQVIFRYFIKKPIAISTELTTIFFPWIVCLSMIVIARREGNTALVLFFDKFKGKAKHVVSLFVYFVMLAFSYLMTIASFRLSRSLAGEILPLTRISKAFTYGSMVVGFSGVTIVMVFLIIRYVLKNMISTDGENV